MEIRKILPSELDDPLNLYEHLHNSDEPLPNREKIETTWREIQKNPSLKYLGVYIDDKLVSSCTLSIISNPIRGCKPYKILLRKNHGDRLKVTKKHKFLG